MVWWALFFTLAAAFRTDPHSQAAFPEIPHTGNNAYIDPSLAKLWIRFFFLHLWIRCSSVNWCCSHCLYSVDEFSFRVASSPCPPLISIWSLAKTEPLDPNSYLKSMSPVPFPKLIFLKKSFITDVLLHKTKKSPRSNHSDHPGQMKKGLNSSLLTFSTLL